MAKELELSFSQFKHYRLCPARYKADVDKVQPPETAQEKYNRAFGNIMGAVAEQFYKGQLFMKLTDANALQQVYMTLRDRIPILYSRFLGGVKVGEPGRPETKEETILRCENALKRFLSGVVENRLFGVYTNAEIVLRVRIPQYNITLNGRPDLAVVSQQGQSQRIVIVDFKSRPSNAVVTLQLAWYALLWYYKFHVVPTEIGFFYFEPTEGKPIFESYRFTVEDLRKIMAEVLAIRDAILADTQFKPKVNDQCWNCGIRTSCPVSPYYKTQEAVKALQGSCDVLPGMALAEDVPPPVQHDETTELTDFSHLFPTS